MSYSWFKPEKFDPAKLEGNISNEIVRNLPADQKYALVVDKKVSTAEVNDHHLSERTDDFEKELIAKMIQMQFDKGDDQKLTEEKDFEMGSEDEDLVDIKHEKDWDIFDDLDKFSCVPRPVFKGKKKIKTTEFATSNEGRNARKLSNKVFNSLEIPSYNKEFRRYKAQCHQKQRPTFKLLGIDQHACRIIHEMIRDGLLYKVSGIYSFGEGLVILRGDRKHASNCYLITVFKVNLKQPKARLNACQQAEKAAADCKKIYATGVSCCYFVAQRGNVLVTSYQGVLLRDCKVADYNPFWICVNGVSYGAENVYFLVRDVMKKYYEENFIHVELSENNITFLYFRIYIIHVSHCVERSHKDAFNYLFRSCTNIVNFFKRTGVPQVEPDDLFKHITGCSFLDKVSLSELQESIKTSACHSVL